MPIEIVDVNISLQTTGVSRAGFGTPLFVGSHRWFNERVRSYNSLTAAAVDLPAGSNEYAAVTAFFSQSPSAQTVKVGRRESDLILTPDAPVDGDIFTVVILDNDGNTVTASYTAGAIDDEEAVVDGIKAAIDADTPVAANVTTTKNGTGTSATLTLTPTLVTNSFAISGLVKLTDTYTSTEVAGDVLAAINLADSDYYFVTASDHTETFVLAMAASVEATQKLYFVSNQEVGALATLAVPATDLLGKLEALNYLRTVSLFHQTADTTFPECAFAGKGAPYNPGTITWALKRLGGVSASANTTTGNTLSGTEQDNLDARNANYIKEFAGSAVTWQAKVTGGNWIDEIRIVDFLTARIREAYQLKLLNSLKVPYTDSGINAMRGVLTSTLGQYTSTDVQPNILQENNAFTTSFPRAADVSFADKTARTLTGSFTAFLAGAVHIVQINGTLTLEAAS
jgi:hypothetical protein